MGACTASRAIAAARSGWRVWANWRPIAGTVRALHRQRRMGADDGLPLVAPSGLSVDAAGIVWMSSVRGLIRVDPDAAARCASMACATACRARSSTIAPVASRRDGQHPGRQSRRPGAVRSGRQCVRTRSAPHLVIESIDARRGDQRIAFFPARPFKIRPRRPRPAHRRAPAVVQRRTQSRATASASPVTTAAGSRSGSVGERVFSQLEAGPIPAAGGGSHRRQRLVESDRRSPSPWRRRGGRPGRRSPASSAWPRCSAGGWPMPIASASSAATPGSWPSTSASSPSRHRWPRPSSWPRSATRCARR